MPRPIIVLGFGRSGTTWLADMISRATGQYILFEPLHPSVTEHAYEWSYRRTPPDECAAHLRLVAAKGFYRPWLLRNHLPARIEHTAPALLTYLWGRAEIGGWKEIRLNFAIPWLIEHELGQPVFITRDPATVISSILNRQNFWEFGGLHDIYAMTVGCRMPHFRPDTEVEMIAQMWAHTHAVALEDCATHGVPVVAYEHLENDPFGMLGQVLAACGLPLRPLHPSYVLTASMTADVEVRPQFWRRKLTAAERDTIAATLERFGVRYPPLLAVPQTRTG
jgi:hypothetical protein